MQQMHKMSRSEAVKNLAGDLQISQKCQKDDTYDM